MGWHPRAEHAAPEMVAVAVLRHDPLGGGLLDRVSLLAARVLLHQGRVRLAVARRGGFGPRRAQGAAWPDGGKAQVGIAAGDRVGSDTPRFRARAGSPGLRGELRALPRCGRRCPNLNDDEWIWGGNLDEIAQTIRHGVRSGEADARQGAAMPAFGRDGILKRADVENVGDFVRSLAGAAPDPKADLTAGKKVFLDNCAVCHGETGKGQRELGAPNLSDAIWLY